MKNLAPGFSAPFVPLLAFGLSVIPLFYLARRIYSKNAAYGATLLYVTNGFLQLHGNPVLSESVSTFLVLLLFYGLHETVQNPRPSLYSGLFMGLIGGLSFLMRPDGILFYGAGALALVTLGSKPLKWKAGFILLSLAGFLFFSSPYLWFVSKNTGRVHGGDTVTEILARRGLDLSRSAEHSEMKKKVPGLTEDKEKIKSSESIEKFDFGKLLTRSHFFSIRSLAPSLLYCFVELNKYLFGGIGFIFIGACFLSVPWDSRRKKSELVLLFFLSTFIFQLLGEPPPQRYFYYVPIFLLWMGNGLEVFRSWAKKSFPYEIQR